jgi:hypothetical protein
MHTTGTIAAWPACPVTGTRFAAAGMHGIGRPNAEVTPITTDPAGAEINPAP